MSLTLATVIGKRILDYFRKRKLRKDISKLKYDIKEDLEGIERVVSTAKTNSFQKKPNGWSNSWEGLDEARREILDLENEIDTAVIGNSIEERKEQKQVLNKVKSYTSTFADEIYLEEEEVRRKGFTNEYAQNLAKNIIPEVKKLEKSIELKSTGFLESKKTRDDLMLAIDSLENKLRRCPPVYSPYPKGQFLDPQKWDVKREGNEVYGSYKKGLFRKELLRVEAQAERHPVDFNSLAKEFRETDSYLVKMIFSTIDQPYLKEQIQDIGQGKGNVILYEASEDEIYRDETDPLSLEFSGYIKGEPSTTRVEFLDRFANEDDELKEKDLKSKLNMDDEQISNLREDKLVDYFSNSELVLNKIEGGV